MYEERGARNLVLEIGTVEVNKAVGCEWNYLVVGIFFIRMLFIIGIFFVLLLSLNINYMKKIFQPSLFPLKGAFVPKDFEEKMSSSHFIDCVRDGITIAFQKTQKVFSDGKMSLRNESNYLHEAVYNAVLEQIEIRMPEESVDCPINQYGSERLFIQYAGYIFIFKKKGSRNNDTAQSKSIENQEAENHIITIEYDLDALRTSIQTINFQYKLGGVVEYYYPITVRALSIDDVVVPEIEPKKPQLKIDRKKVSNL